MANNVIKISRVGPATSLVDPLILPLTFFDLVWLPDKPTNRVIFYKLTESYTDSFYSVILPKLEQSLSLVLTHFHPLSGHVKWDPQDPKPCIVVFPQDTVSLTVAEITDADFSRVSGKGLRHQTELHPLVSELPVFSSDSASAFTLQITLFPKQGFCVGLTINHLVMDGKTVVKFLKSWAHICKYGTTPQDIHLPMILDRKVINIPPELESDFFRCTPYLSGNVRTLKFHSTKKTEDLVRVTLELTQENVKKLRDRAKSESTLSDDLHLSTFVLTYAYVLTCVVKARGDDGDRPVPFTFAADFRDRLDPPVPVNYIGNCALPISFSGDKAKTFLGEDGFVNAVKILSDSVKGLDSRGAESIWELYEEGLKNMELGSAQKLSVSGSNKFGIYGCDFGWGRPVSTENVFFNKNLLFSMTEMRDETGGVEIGMCLQKCVMDGFISVFQNGL